MRRGRGVNRGPGLASTMARTAVIAGTATVTAGVVAGRQQQKAQAQAAAVQQQQTVADLQQQVAQLQTEQAQAELAPVAAAPAPAAGGDDLLAQLAQLGQLRDAGVLSEDEFNLAKARILGQ